MSRQSSNENHQCEKILKIIRTYMANHFPFGFYSVRSNNDLGINDNHLLSISEFGNKKHKTSRLFVGKSGTTQSPLDVSIARKPEGQ